MLSAHALRVRALRTRRSAGGGDRWRSFVGQRSSGLRCSQVSQYLQKLEQRVKDLEEQGAQPRATPSPSEAAGGTSSKLPSCQIDLVGRGLVKRHDGRGAPFNDRKRSAG
jgi:hypothetical protein